MGMTAGLEPRGGKAAEGGAAAHGGNGETGPNAADGQGSAAGVLADRMAALVSDMWRQASDAWYRRDSSVAPELAERDHELDDLHESLIGELASGGMAIPVTMEMTLVARFYERLGDHAVNVARRVVYLAGSQPPELRVPRRGHRLWKRAAPLSPRMCCLAVAFAQISVQRRFTGAV